MKRFTQNLTIHVIGVVIGALITACANVNPATVAAPPASSPTATVSATPPSPPPTAIVSVTPLPPTPEPTPRAPELNAPQLERTLLERLQQGGYVIYFRHARTDRTQSDASNLDYDDCLRQRNLTEEGRSQARAIGEAFRTLAIPVGRVIASPYCRTRETAELAFGAYERVPSYNQTAMVTQQILSTPPAAGGNTVIVAHGFIIRDLVGVSIAEGEAVVLQPTGPDNPGVIGRVSAEVWTDWLSP